MKSSLLAIIPASILTVTSASAALYADDFNRANSTALGSTSDGGFSWTETGAGNTDFSITSNTLRLDSQSPHESRRAFVDFDLDATPNYVASFTMITSSIGGGAGVFILPRAEGTDIPGNSGWIVTNDNIFTYAGGARSGGVISEGNNSVFGWTNNTTRDISIAVTGNSAELFVGSVSRSTINLGSLAANSTPDRFIFGYNQVVNTGRNLTMNIDNFTVAVPEPASASLAILSFGLIALRHRR